MKTYIFWGIGMLFCWASFAQQDKPIHKHFSDKKPDLKELTNIPRDTNIFLSDSTLILSGTKEIFRLVEMSASYSLGYTPSFPQMPCFWLSFGVKDTSLRITRLLVETPTGSCLSEHRDKQQIPIPMASYGFDPFTVYISVTLVSTYTFRCEGQAPLPLKTKKR